jgi:hypothetical protein
MTKQETAWNNRQLTLFFSSLSAGIIGGGLAALFGVAWILGAPSTGGSAEVLLDRFSLGSVLGTFPGVMVGVLSAKRDRPAHRRRAMIIAPILAAAFGFLGAVLVVGTLIGCLLRTEGA